MSGLDERTNAIDATAELETLRESVGVMQGLLQSELFLGWYPTTAISGLARMTRFGIYLLAERAREHYYSDPLIRRAVEVTANYVWGQGVSISSTDTRIQEVIDDFSGDPRNNAEIGEQQGWAALDRTLSLDGNLFFMFFADNQSGHVRIRSIPLSQIMDIVGDPEDWKTPLYYRRSSVGVDGRLSDAYHPDINNPLVWSSGSRPDTYNGIRIIWDAPLYHVAANCLPDMPFGVSEVSVALEWSTAYKNALKLLYKLLQSRTRISQLLVDKKATKTDLPYLRQQVMNPQPVTGATMVAQGDVEFRSLDVAGGMPSPDYARRYLLQVCAATGISEPFLAGDSATSNLATATALERPLELQFLARQELWRSIITEIYRVVLRWAAIAPQGLLAADVIERRQRYWPYEPVYTLPPEESGEEEVTLCVDVRFPAILRDQIDSAAISVISSAAVQGVIPAEFAIEQILRALKTPEPVDKATELYQQLLDTEVAYGTEPDLSLVAAAERLEKRIREFQEAA